MKNCEYIPTHDAYVGRHDNRMIAWIVRKGNDLTWATCYSQKRDKHEAIARFRTKVKTT